MAELREFARHSDDLERIGIRHSLAPNVLKAHLAVYQAAMHSPGELSRIQREMIAVAVSAANSCHY
jgi:alkylhydroperoxidase family enzyme